MLPQLQHVKDNQKLNHAYLFEGSKRSLLKKEMMDFAKLILGNDELTHNKIDQLNHPDFLLIESSEQTIKKEAIELVLHKMNQKPVESKYKVYVIIDFDKVTAQGENSILKFLEEPPDNTIALLSTAKPRDILPTIHSRCQHIHIQSQVENLDSLLTTHNITKSVASTLETLLMSEEDATFWLDDNDFLNIRQELIKWCQSLLNDGTISLIKIADLMNVLNQRDKQLLGLDMLQLYFQDMLYVKLDAEPKAFDDDKETMQAFTNQNSASKIVSMIDFVTEAKAKLLQYVSAVLVFEQLNIRIMMG